MLKRLFGCLVIGFAIQATWAQAALAATYGGRIVIPPDSSKELQSTVEDVAGILQKITGEAFAMSNEYTGAGILLAQSDGAQAPAALAKRLAGKGREPFVIQSNDKDRLWIVANGEAGLRHGLYYYLEQLGARFYFPNERWTILPKRADIALAIDKLVEPDYRMREFAGSGGFGPAMPVDAKGDNKARWALWKQRNRFGGEFTLGGHSGEAFNTEKKKILEQHPEYLAKVGDEFGPWSLIAKLNPSNPDALKLYVDWSVERFRRQRKANPYSFAVSVDPADGGGHCTCDECKKIGNGSPSDQVYYIANAVAKAVRAEFPDGYVNLYAYNEHAMTPSFPLEPNVYISVIPYAFQRTGLTPEEFIRMWGQKAAKMSIYDYWSIPDWTQDEPDFNLLQTPGKKLRLWHDNKIEGFLAESTFSAGAIGAAWIVGSHLMWDLKTDEKAVLDDFFQKSFGPAAPPMRRMLTRWSNGFLLVENELALSFRDLQEAARLAQGNDAVLARISDYGRYVQYLRLRHAWQTARKDTVVQAKADLVRHVWRIYDSSMIHSYRIYQLLARGDADIAAAYNLKDKNAPGWALVTPLTDAEALQLIEDGVRDLKPLDFAPRSYTGEMVPLPAGAQGSAAPNQAGDILLVGRNVLELHAPATMKTLNLKFGSADPAKLQLLDENGKVLGEKDATQGAAGLTDFSVAIPQAGRYRLVLSQEKNNQARLQVPAGTPLLLRDFRTSKPRPSGKLYFYVPAGQKTIAMYVLPLPENMRPRLWDAAGKPVEFSAHDGGKILFLEVPAGQDGKVWTIDRIIAPNEGMRMLNVPQVFAFSPEALMVPRDALEK